MNGELSFAQFAGQDAAPPPPGVGGDGELSFSDFASGRTGAQNYAPVIDVGGASGAPMGQPGSQFAPSQVDPNATPAPNAMPTPNLDATRARLRAQQAAAAPPAGPSTGTLANIGAGTGEATTGLLGLPVDATTGAINLGLRGFTAGARALNSAVGAPAPPAQAPQITNPVGGSQWWNSAAGLIGADPRNIVPADQTEQVARAAGRGAASMLLPWGVARALPVMAGIPGAVQSAFGAGGAPTQAAAGFAGGAAGQVAENAAPPPFKPLANFAGQMIGGGSVISSVAATKALLDVAAPSVQTYIAPFTEAGRQQLAGQRIANAATDLGAVRDALSNPPPPLVPGSQPTTYQLTGDPGLGNLERVAATQNPDAFLGRMGAQNTARVDALQTLAPETASPSAVGDAFRQRLADMDAAGDAQVAAARQAAQGATESLGGAVPTGADAQTSALQGYGQQLRGGLDAANQAMRARVSQLYDQVDPDGTLAVDMSGIRAAAKGITGSIPKNAAPMAGEPAAILGTARMLAKVQPFSEVAALRSRITDAMRAELYDNGRSQTYRRLTQLLGAVDDTLARGVEQRAAEDAAAVSAGVKARGGTMLGRLQGQNADGAPPDITGPGMVGRPPGLANPGAGVRQPLPGGHSGPGQAAGLPERPGQTNAGGRGGGVGAGNRGLASGAAAQRTTRLTPNFDAAAAARYRAANAAHAQRVRTFEGAPGVGQVLATGQRAGEWRLGDSQVAATIFNSGKGAAERVQAFLRAGGDNAALASDLKDYAAFSLRRAAEDADGTLDPAKGAKWLNGHQEALSAFPELRTAFGDAVSARATMDEVAARHIAARTAFEKSAAAHFLGDADPVARVGRVLRSDNAAATMRELASLTARSPAARAGLQRATIDFMMGELRSNAQAGAERAFKVDTFQTFVRRSVPALRQIFSDDQVQAIQNIAVDLQRSQRSTLGSKLPGGSNTAQDLAAGAKHGHGGPSTMGLLVAAESAGEAVQHVVGPFGKVFGMVAAAVGNAMRQAGLHTVNDLVAEAMLHPDLARTLLMKVPTPPAARLVGQAAGRQIRALAAQAAGNSGQREPSPLPSRFNGLATPSTSPPVSAWPR